MSVRIGLVAARPETAVDLAVLATSVGARVEPLAPPDAAGLLGMPDADGSARAVIVVDVAGASTWPGGPGAIEHRGGGGLVVVVHRPGEEAAARAFAVRLGADHVVTLPGGTPWLAAQLRAPVRSGLLGVVGAAGGVGTSTVAMACALAAGSDCLLVDADRGSAGLDLPLGIGDEVGGRWDCIPDSAEPLVAESVRAALPEVGGVHVLTGPRADPPGRRLDRVLEVGRSAFARTVVDLGRGAEATRLTRSDQAVVVTSATLSGVVATRRLLDTLAVDQVLLAVRPSGWLALADVVDQLGGPRAVEVPRIRRLGEMADCADLLGGRTGRRLDRLGRRVWAGLA